MSENASELRSALQKLLTLDRRLAKTLDVQKQWCLLQDAARQNPYDPPRIRNLLTAPLKAFLFTFLMLLALTLLLAVTGLAFDHFLFSYVLYLPLLLEEFLFSRLGISWPLPGTLTPENIRIWMNWDERYSVLLHCLAAVALVAVLVFLFAFFVNLVCRIVAYKKEKAAYPKTEDEYLKAEKVRVEKAQKICSDFLDAHRGSIESFSADQAEFDALADSIGLLPEYRFGGYLREFSESVSKGRAATLAEAIDLYKKDAAKARQLEMRREAEEQRVSYEKTQAEFVKKVYAFSPAARDSKVYSEILKP